MLADFVISIAKLFLKAEAKVLKEQFIRVAEFSVVCRLGAAHENKSWSAFFAEEIEKVIGNMLKRQEAS